MVTVVGTSIKRHHRPLFHEMSIHAQTSQIHAEWKAGRSRKRFTAKTPRRSRMVNRRSWMQKRARRERRRPRRPGMGKPMAKPQPAPHCHLTLCQRGRWRSLGESISPPPLRLTPAGKLTAKTPYLRKRSVIEDSQKKRTAPSINPSPMTAAQPAFQSEPPNKPA